MSSEFIPVFLAKISSKEIFESFSDNAKSGNVSFCALNLYPLFTSLFMWIATLGIINKFLSTLICLISGLKGLSDFKTTLPATDNGRSNHVLSIGPP